MIKLTLYHFCKLTILSFRFTVQSCSDLIHFIFVKVIEYMTKLLARKNKFSTLFCLQVDRMMDLIVNSLYSNKEVFLRELISNASDALDKIRFVSLTEKDALSAESALEIRIKADPEAGTISIEWVLMLLINSEMWCWQLFLSSFGGCLWHAMLSRAVLCILAFKAVSEVPLSCMMFWGKDNCWWVFSNYFQPHFLMTHKLCCNKAMHLKSAIVTFVWIVLIGKKGRYSLFLNACQSNLCFFS